MKVFQQKPEEPSLPWRKKPELKVPGNNVLAEWCDDNEVKFSDLTDDQKEKFLKDEATFKYDGDGLIVLHSKEIVDNYDYSIELREFELEQARYAEDMKIYNTKLAVWEKEQREREIAELEKQISDYNSGELEKRLKELKNGS